MQLNLDIARKRMIDQVVARGISDRRVIEAMSKIRRHLFVEEAMAAQAYSDTSLPIGERQTISQPHTVALMTESLKLSGREKVLEIGTGSGYQAAVLATLCDKVYTIERFRTLAMRARKALDSHGLLNVNIRIGDGSCGWPEEAPFDAIIVTAGAPALPADLVDQLAPGGRMVIPVGDEAAQTMLIITKDADGSVRTERTIGCRFVKLVGRSGWQAKL